MTEIEYLRLALAAEQGKPTGARSGWAVCSAHAESRYVRTYPDGARGVVLGGGEWYLWAPPSGSARDGRRLARGQAPDAYAAQAEADTAHSGG